jgi:hypothetical protein
MARTRGRYSYRAGPVYRPALDRPQAVLIQDYIEEITAALNAAGQKIFRVVLDADEATLRSRVKASDEAREWRLAHLPEYQSARAWLLRTADLVIDTSHQAPIDVARCIVQELPELSR